MCLVDVSHWVDGDLLGIVSHVPDEAGVPCYCSRGRLPGRLWVRGSGGGWGLIIIKIRVVTPSLSLPSRSFWNSNLEQKVLGLDTLGMQRF